MIRRLMYKILKEIYKILQTESSHAHNYFCVLKTAFVLCLKDQKGSSTIKGITYLLRSVLYSWNQSIFNLLSTSYTNLLYAALKNTCMC